MFSFNRTMETIISFNDFVPTYEHFSRRPRFKQGVFLVPNEQRRDFYKKNIWVFELGRGLVSPYPGPPRNFMFSILCLAPYFPFGDRGEFR